MTVSLLDIEARLEGFAAGESVRLLKDATDVPLRTMGSISVVRQLLKAGLVESVSADDLPAAGRAEWSRMGVRRGRRVRARSRRPTGA